MWNLVERKIDDERKIAVHRAIANLGHQTASEEYKFTTCEDFYIELHNKFAAKFGLAVIPLKKQEVIKKNGKKPHLKNKSSAADIKKKNMNKKALDEYLRVEEYFSNPVLVGNYSKYDFCEIKVIALLNILHITLNDVDPNMEFVYELYIGSKKVMQNLKQIQQYMSTVKQNYNFEYCVNDLNFMVNQLKAKYNLTYEEVLKSYPRLCLSTCFDTVFPSINIKPYQSQIELMEFVKANPTALVLFKSRIGSGKTTLIIALAKWAQEVGKKVIFTCCNEPVRIQGCNMLYNMGIPFAIAVTDKKSVRIINNNNCTDETRVVIVTDLKTTYNLIKDNNDYVLFLDEPAVGADIEGHPVTNAVAKILRVSPKVTILSSASMPDIPLVVDYFKEKYPGIAVTKIISKETFIGCSITQHNNKELIPFGYCKNKKDLENVIIKLKTKSFIDRLLPAPLTLALYHKVKPLCATIDLENYFDQDISYLSQTYIQFIAIQLLENMLSLNDEQIFTICSSFTEDVYLNIPEPELMVTTNAHKYGTCLYVSEDPFKEGMKLYKELFAHYNVNIVDLLNDYDREKAKFMNQDIRTNDKKSSSMKDLQDKLSSASSKPKSAYYDGHSVKVPFVTKSKIIAKTNCDISTITYSDKNPVIPFPKWLQVNTQAHVEKFAPNPDAFHKSLYQYPLNLENLSSDLNIPDWVHYLLFCGIGIYSPSNSLANQKYNDLVLELASDKSLAFILSDESMSCGADYPLSNVLIEEAFANNHSINTIFQLLGRAGRSGTSWTARGHVGPNLYERIMNYITTNDSEIDIEAINISNAFLNYTDDTDKVLHNGTLIAVEKVVIKDVIPSVNTSSSSSSSNSISPIREPPVSRYIPVHRRAEVQRRTEDVQPWSRTSYS